MLIGEMISAIKVGLADREQTFYKAQFSSLQNFAFVVLQDRVLIEGVEFTASSGRTFKLDAEYDLKFVVFQYVLALVILLIFAHLNHLF